MSWTGEILRKMLDRYVIKRGSGYPPSLEGMILLEEGDFGWIVASPEDVARILNMRDNPELRPAELRGLDKASFEEKAGWRKYLEKWRREGINI